MSNQPKHPKVAKGRPVTDKRKKAISDKARTFVDEYLVDLNATQAAIRAGYSKGTARQTACEMLSRPEIQELVSKAMKERSERTKIDADWLLRRLAAQADADIGDLLNPDGSLKPADEWPEVWRRGLVTGIEVTEDFDGTGKQRKQVGWVKKVKLVDRTRLLELIGKHISVGAFRELVGVSDPNGKPLPAAQVVPVFNITLTEEKES